MSASSRLDLDNELNRNGETRNDVDFEDGNFLALKPNYDQREHTHHKYYLLVFEVMPIFLNILFLL